MAYRLFGAQPLHDDVIKWKHFPRYWPFRTPVPDEFPTQRPVTRSFDVYFDLRPNKRLSKQTLGWWFETLSPPLWRHLNDPMPQWHFRLDRWVQTFVKTMNKKHLNFNWMKFNSKCRLQKSTPCLGHVYLPTVITYFKILFLLNHCHLSMGQWGVCIMLISSSSFWIYSWSNINYWFLTWKWLPSWLISSVPWANVHNKISWPLMSNDRIDLCGCATCNMNQSWGLSVTAIVWIISAKTLNMLWNLIWNILNINRCLLKLNIYRLN